MFNLQGSEIIFILLIALVVLGPEKLPGAIRKATKTYAEFRKMSNSFQTEFKSVIDEPLREMRETADLLKEAADPMKIADDAEREAAQAAKAKREAAAQADGDASAPADGDATARPPQQRSDAPRPSEARQPDVPVAADEATDSTDDEFADPTETHDPEFVVDAVGDNDEANA